MTANDAVAANPSIRTFASGARRDGDDGKFDYEAFLSPAVVEAYGTYMHFHRRLADGSLRAGDDWQKGFPPASYVKSLWRHFHEFWKLWRAGGDDGLAWACCAILFNVMGFLHEHLKANPGALAADLRAARARSPAYAALADQAAGVDRSAARQVLAQRRADFEATLARFDEPPPHGEIAAGPLVP